MLEYLIRSALIGAGATLVIDLWALVMRRAVGWASLDFALVGRWLGHMAKGRFRHQRVADAPAISGERALGWFAHYAIGIALAALLLAIGGLEWARQPTFSLALGFGLVSVALPFLVLQPALGAGVAASRTPRPGLARLRSVATHLWFGVGLYLTALLTAWLWPAA